MRPDQFDATIKINTARKRGRNFSEPTPPIPFANPESASIANSRAF